MHACSTVTRVEVNALELEKLQIQMIKFSDTVSDLNPNALWCSVMPMRVLKNGSKTHT